MPLGLTERDRRYDLVRRNMAAENLDALILFGRTGVGVRWGGDFSYLSGYQMIFSIALLYFPLEAEPILFVPGENQYLGAERAGWIGDLRLSSNPAGDLIAEVKNAAPRKIGISSLDALPAAVWKELQEGLGGTEWAEASSAVFSAREAKSGEEKAAARLGGEVADRGWARALEVLRAGMSERELFADIENVMSALGAHEYFDMLGAGRAEGDEDLFRGFVVPPTDRRFQAGDLALFELTPRVEGYWNQIVRLVSFGEPPEYIKKAHAACLDAKHKGLEKLRPGARFREVARAVGEGLEAHGFAMKGVGSVHTTGLDLSETLMNLESDREIEPGLLVTIHPMTNIGEWRQLFVGETYFVGEKGPEPMNRCSEEIAIIS